MAGSVICMPGSVTPAPLEFSIDSAIAGLETNPLEDTNTP